MDSKKIKIFPEKFNTIIDLGNIQDTLSRTNIIPVADNNGFMESLVFTRFVSLNKKKSRPTEPMIFILEPNFFDFIPFFKFDFKDTPKSGEDNLSIRYVNDSFKGENNRLSHTNNSLIANVVFEQKGILEPLIFPKGSKNFTNSPEKNDVYDDRFKAANCKKALKIGSGAMVLNSIPEELKKNPHFNFLTLSFRKGDFKIPSKSQIQCVSSKKFGGRFKNQPSRSKVGDMLSHKWILPLMWPTHLGQTPFIQKVPYKTFSLLHPITTNSEYQKPSLIYDIQRVKIEYPLYSVKKNERLTLIPSSDKNYSTLKNDPNFNFYNELNTEEKKINFNKQHLFPFITGVPALFINPFNLTQANSIFQRLPINNFTNVLNENLTQNAENQEKSSSFPINYEGVQSGKIIHNYVFANRTHDEKIKIDAKNLNSLSSISNIIFSHNKKSVLKTSDSSIEYSKLKKDGIKESESNIKSELLPNIEESKIHSNFLNEMYTFLIKKYFNFPSTRIHTDAIANNLAKSLNAEAFTLGEDIFFASGKFNLSDLNSIALLGHELTHVKQQMAAGGPFTKNSMDKSRYNSLENQATENENAISRFFSFPQIPRNFLQQQKIFHPFQNQVVASPTTLGGRFSLESKPQLNFSAIPQLKPVSSGISEMPSFSNNEESMNSEAKKEQISEIISPEIDIDEIAEKVFSVLKRKLIIDRERRGKWVV